MNKNFEWTDHGGEKADDEQAEDDGIRDGKWSVAGTREAKLKLEEQRDHLAIAL